MNTKKLASYLGFARRARTIVIGRTAVMAGCKRGDVKLILFASDASGKMIRSFENVKVPSGKLNNVNKLMLGQMMQRHEVAIVGLCDTQLARAILTLL